MTDIKERLIYCQESGLFFHKAGRGVRHGTKAGYLNPSGYVSIRVNRKLYLAHRLAWFFTYGEWPKGNLDHIDGDPSNNRISNLREASQSQNISNSKLSIANSSGIKGVSWDSGKRLWRASIGIDRKQKLVGRFKNFEEAVAAREAAEKMHHGEFRRMVF